MHPSRQANKWRDPYHENDQLTSNAVPPSVTPPSPNEWSQDLLIQITGITRGFLTTITAPGHGMSSSSNGSTFTTFKQVVGMLPINGQTTLVQTVVDDDTFIVPIDSTNFPNYVAHGVVIIDTGIPPVQQAGFQYFNRPFQNIG